jgi:hypothetical protein
MWALNPFNIRNPSTRAIALDVTQRLTEISTITKRERERINNWMCKI